MVFGKVWARENRDELKISFLFFPQILRTPDYFADIAPPIVFSHEAMQNAIPLSVYMHGDSFAICYLYIPERIRLDHGGHTDHAERSIRPKKRDLCGETDREGSGGGARAF